MLTAYQHDGSLGSTQLSINGDTISNSTITNAFYDEAEAAAGRIGVTGNGWVSGGNEGLFGSVLELTNATLQKTYSLEATGTAATALRLRNETDSADIVAWNSTGSIETKYGTKFNYRGSIPTTGTIATGEFIFNTGAGPGEPMFWQCIVGNSSGGIWSPGPPTAGCISKTANYTVTAANNGQRYDNYGATGTITFPLPAGAQGLGYEFKRSVAYAMRIDPNGTEIIRGGTAGQLIELQTDGANIRVEWDHNAGLWEITRAIGTTAFV